MKKIILFFFILGFTSLTAFAQSPLLNESFESFTVSETSFWKVNAPNIEWQGVGATSVQVVDNPNKSGINRSNNVLKIIRSASTITTDLEAAGLTYKGILSDTYGIPMNTNSIILEIKVLKTVAGTVGVRIYPNKSITNSSGNPLFVTADLQGSTNWQNVQFDISSIVPFRTGTPQIRFEVEKQGTLDAQKNYLEVLVDDFRILGLTSGISELNGAEKIISYIDPVTSLLTIQNLPAEPCSVILTNLSGIECRRVNINETKTAVDISDLHSGIYILSCYSGSGKIYAGKIVK